MIECLEGFLPVARQPLERPAVQVFQQGPDALIQVGQGEERVVAQPRQDPAFNDLYAHLRFGFILGLVGPCRQHRDLIVRRQLLVAGVQVRIVPTGLADTATEIIGDCYLRNTAEVLKGTHMTHQPVLQPLAPGGFGVGVIGGTQYGNKHLSGVDLTGLRIDDRYGGATVINEALFTGLVDLAHGALLLLLPVPEAVTVLRVAVTSIGILGSVFLPQQLLGHVFAFEFLIDGWPVRQLIAGGRSGIGAGIEHGCQAAIVQVLWQWPGNLQGIGPGQELLDGPDTGLGAGADLPDREPGFQP